MPLNQGLFCQTDEWREFLKEHKSGFTNTASKKKLKHVKYFTFNPFIVENFGCSKCVLKDHCDMSEEWKGRGICAPRAKMFGEYLQAGHGETIPLMKDLLAKLMMEKDLEEARWRKLGLPPTKEWLSINAQTSKLMERIHMAEKGIKIDGGLSLLDQMRGMSETLMIDTPEGRAIIQKKKKVETEDERDNNESDGRTETEVQREV